MVLPCEPATATPYFIRMSSASISARGMIGTDSRRASRTSTLSGAIAEEVTRTSAPLTRSAAWPVQTFAPSPRRRRTGSPAARSEPVTT